MALPGPQLVLSEDALQRLVQSKDIGELHHILRPTALWRDEDEQADLDRTINRELAGQPVWERTGRLDRDFEDSLRCLCRPEVAYVGFTHIQGRFRHILACSLGREGILAVRENGRTTLRQADPANLPGALVAALPDHPAARFQPISLPLEDAPKHSTDVMHKLNAGQASNERKLWDQLAAQRQVGSGQIVLELRDSMGRAKETDEPLTYVDLDVGCWYHVVEHRGDRRYLFCAPATRPELAKHVGALQRRLATT
jgi:hypothetical protein